MSPEHLAHDAQRKKRANFRRGKSGRTGNWRWLLPDLDTVNGELFDLKGIAPCVGTCTTKRLSSHVQSLYPNWEGRYRFMLKHVLCVVKRYLRDGNKAHSREELIRRVRVKFYGADN